MLLQILGVFFLSMVPIIELRGAVPLAVGLGIPEIPALILCTIGNMIPVPFIFLFARKVLEWGKDKKLTQKFFRFCLKKGENLGEKLVKKGGASIYVALYLFVAIPIPGTGAWTGTLAASILNLNFKQTVIAVLMGVVTAGTIMLLISLGVFNFLS